MKLNEEWSGSKKTDFYKYLKEDGQIQEPDPENEHDIDYEKVDQFLSTPIDFVKHNVPNYQKVFEMLESDAVGIDKDKIDPGVCEVADSINAYRQEQYNQLRSSYDIPILNHQNELKHVLDIDALRTKTQADYLAETSMVQEHSVCLSEDDDFIDTKRKNENKEFYHLRTWKVHGKVDRPHFMVPNQRNNYGDKNNVLKYKSKNGLIVDVKDDKLYDYTEEQEYPEQTELKGEFEVVDAAKHFGAHEKRMLGIKCDEDEQVGSERSQKAKCEMSFLDNHDPLHENDQDDSLYNQNWSNVSAKEDLNNKAQLFTNRKQFNFLLCIHPPFLFPCLSLKKRCQKF